MDRSVPLVSMYSFGIIVSVPNRVALVPAPRTVSCKSILCSRLKSTEIACGREGWREQAFGCEGARRHTGGKWPGHSCKHEFK